MTALAKPELLRALAARELIITPILWADQVGDSSIDLRLGCVALIARARGLSHVDPAAHIRGKERDERLSALVREKDAEEHARMISRQQRHERHEIPFKRPFLLHPGTLALVPTLEWVKTSPRHLGLVTARSSWARQGLSIATATLINPGYEGIITLELANLGHIPIKLYPGLRIAQLAIQLLTDPPPGKLPRRSQFNNAFEPVEGTIVGDDACFLPEETGKPSNSRR